MHAFTRPVSRTTSLRKTTGYIVCRSISSKASDPLRILFCGSDRFSIASLRAVFQEHATHPDIIASIDVVCRPGKPTGRGLKVIREAPIKDVAQKELGLPLHEIDTFTGWIPPKPKGRAVNLVIAVSFGLLVPKRILNGAKYGGLNVHPSLLPDLSGPAPIHHALLLGREKTGISVQTLHPKHFDQGTILAQTPFPGFSIPNAETCTPSALTDALAPLGAQMLVETLRKKLHVPPYEDVGWYGKQALGREFAHAPKISTEDRRILWIAWGAETIMRRNRVLENLWDDSIYGRYSGEDAKRIIFHGWEEVRFGNDELIELSRVQEFEPGVPFALRSPKSEICFPTCDQPPRFLKVTSCTVEGSPKGTGVNALIGLLNRARH